MENQKILIPVVALLVVAAGAGGFFAGMQYQKTRQVTIGDFQGTRKQFGTGPQTFGTGPQTQERMEGQGLEGRSPPISGEIIDHDEESITVKLLDGSSRIIFVGEAAQINKSTPGTKDDLTAGVQVLVIGPENSDGSITASSIQIGTL